MVFTRQGRGADEVQVVVYPSRVKLALIMVSGVPFLILSAIGARMLFSANQAILALAVTLLAACMCLLALGLPVIRLLNWKPAIVASGAGITDECSFFVGGIGLIPWSTIREIRVSVRRSPILRAWPRSYLLIVAKDANSLNAVDEPQLRRLMRHMISGSGSRSFVALPAFILSDPIDDLLAHIRDQFAREIQSHHITMPSQEPLNELVRRGVSLWPEGQ